MTIRDATAAWGSGEQMKYYCLLHINSKFHDADEMIFRKSALNFLDFQDRESASNIARSDHLRTAGVMMERSAHRYGWTLDSSNGISAAEPRVLLHVSWLLAQLKPKISLAKRISGNIDCDLNFYWSGGGTGGGPLITPELSKLLVQHQICLSFGFYYEPPHLDGMQN
jgi:hypothetical protein